MSCPLLDEHIVSDPQYEATPWVIHPGKGWILVEHRCMFIAIMNTDVVLLGKPFQVTEASHLSAHRHWLVVVYSEGSIDPE